jgi:predicted nucleic acid-binding protein
VIVVDTNIIAALYLAGSMSSLAEQASIKDSLWAAPRLWRSEIRNVLALYMRKGLIDLPKALHIMERAAHLMEEGEHEVDSHQVLHLAAQSGCTAYDCEFVALAKDLDIPLVTIDKQILEHFPDIAISLEKFVTDV